jgi:hypothetical protein
MVGCSLALSTECCCVCLRVQILYYKVEGAVLCSVDKKLTAEQWYSSELQCFRGVGSATINITGSRPITDSTAMLCFRVMGFLYHCDCQQCVPLQKRCFSAPTWQHLVLDDAESAAAACRSV